MAEKKKIEEKVAGNLCDKCKNFFDNGVTPKFCVIASSKPSNEVKECSHFEKK